MKPSEIKKKLVELGYDENKYFEIRDFMHANGAPVKVITNIEANSWTSVYLVIADDYSVTYLEC